VNGRNPFALTGGPREPAAIRTHQSPTLAEKLAWLAQVPQPVVSLLETGMRTWNPSTEQLAALARVLHIEPPEALLQEVIPAELREVAQ
jgi:hypothetical protein